jgi:hypothetical protein
MSGPSEFDLRILPSCPFPVVFRKLVDRIGGTDWEIHVGKRRPLRFHPRRQSRREEIP